MPSTIDPVLRLVESALTDSRIDLQTVRNRFQSESTAGEDLPTYLIRKGAMKPDGVRTLGMISKGYLSIHPSTVINTQALRGLLSTRSDSPHRATSMVEVRPIRTTRQSHLSYLEESKPKTKATSRIGTKLGRCLITRMLGEGGGGTVYEGLHQGLGIPVAVKVIKEGLRGESIRRALRSEARLLAHLDHPNIVRVFDFDDDGEEPFLVMELVSGQSLSELTKQVGPLRPEFAAGAIAQAARGLEAARTIGVIHRDVKPSNILIAKSGQIKIADLGLAVASNQQLQHECGVHGTTDAGTGGTFAYMAPERFSGRGDVEFYSDLYSLGISFFEVLTGRLPFYGTTPFEYMVAHASGPIPLVHEINREVPPAIGKIVSKMMAKEPNERYSNYTELLADLIRVCRPIVSAANGCSTWNSLWDGLTIEISGVIPGRQLARS